MTTDRSPAAQAALDAIAERTLSPLAVTDKSGRFQPLGHEVAETWKADTWLGLGLAVRAAELEALADWLVPEPEEPMFTATDEAFAIWEERKAVRQRLLDEARRARGGGQS